MKWNECVYSKKKKIFFEVNWVIYDRINSFRKIFGWYRMWVCYYVIRWCKYILVL